MQNDNDNKCAEADAPKQSDALHDEAGQDVPRPGRGA